MSFVSCNPATGSVVRTYPGIDNAALDARLAGACAAQREWRRSDAESRARLAGRLAEIIRARRGALAALATLEMGKLTAEAEAELDKCALGCDYYSVYAAPFLDDEPFYTDAGKSYVTYDPLGVVLCIMPWNDPYWQVFRFAVPALMAGNAVVLKHAPNVPQVALAIEALLLEAGFPEGVLTTVFADTDQIAAAIAGPHVQAVTLTGSARAGRQVGAAAGANLKKCVLELGGSDPFVVLADADLELAAGEAVKARFQNCGQSCIAAKRFILVPQIADDFLALLREKAALLVPGDPAEAATSLAPLAREELRAALDAQVRASIAAGAVALLGCEPIAGPGFYYPASILDRVPPATPAYREELFGPVAAVLRAQDEADAIRLANDTPYGLGASLWSRDYARAEELGKGIAAGMTFVNGIAKSDPRLPFGGVKDSGFGRELSYHGIREFVSARTVWIRDRAADVQVERRTSLGDRRRSDRRR